MATSGYKSKYEKQINNVTNKLLKRKKFSYNMNSDSLYNMYKDYYMMQGGYDMRDAMADASGMTGGYASSAAVTAGNQAYQSNLSALNQKAQDTYQFALDKYNQETTELNNRWSILNTLDNQAYTRYRDTVSDSYADKNYELQRAKYGL